MINKAKQIWLSTIKVNQYAEFMHTFNLDKVLESAKFYIYCETEYVISINGNFVGTGQYKSFGNKRVYDSYDVTEMLNLGENEIFVLATHHHTNTQTYVAGVPGVCFALGINGEAVVLSGEDTLARPCFKYRNGDIEMNSPQLGYVYHYDATIEHLSWQKSTVMKCEVPFVSRPVKKLKHLPVNTGRICAQGVLKRCDNSSKVIAEAMQTDYLSYRDISDILSGDIIRKNDDGVYFIIDLGNEYAGLFTMTLKATKGTEINIGYGEQLDDLRVRTYVGERCFASSYICCDGEQSFTGYFRRFAGRYIAIHIVNMTGDVTFDEIGLIPTCYPLDKKEYFKSNDYFYNKLFDVSINTLKLCMHEHYEDSPWREQALYAFDSFVQMRCGYYAYGEYKFARASLELMADGQMENGLIEISSPGCKAFTIPGFALCWVMSLQHYVLFSGDTRFAEKMLPVSKRILDSFKVEDGLVIKENTPTYCYFYEWSDGGTDGYDEYEYTHTDAIINFYYILACESYNEMCGYLGKNPEYNLDIMRQKSYDTFYDSDKGVFCTFLDRKMYHELTQALAILSGVGNRELLAPVLMDKDNGLVKITLSTSIYKYDALLKDDNKYIEFVADDIADVWGDMLFKGAQSFWETSVGPDDFALAGSMCHAWSAVPVYVLYRYFIGFRPLEPGFETYDLNPCATNSISKIEAHLYTPKVALKVKIHNGNVLE